MLNHSSVSSSAGVRDRDLDLPFAIVLSCSHKTQLAVLNGNSTQSTSPMTSCDV
jgi:hypothetical protein